MSDWTNAPFTPTQPAPKPKKSKKWIHFVAYPVLFFVAIGIGSSAGGSDSTNPAAANVKPAATKTVTAPAKPQATVTVTQPAPTQETTEPVETINEGTYEVGVDIQPGKYKTKGDDLCYWARLKDTDGGLDSIIANHIGDGAQTVTIKKTDAAFETRGCGEWKKAD